MYVHVYSKGNLTYLLIKRLFSKNHLIADFYFASVLDIFSILVSSYLMVFFWAKDSRNGISLAYNLAKSHAIIPWCQVGFIFIARLFLWYLFVTAFFVHDVFSYLFCCGQMFCEREGVFCHFNMHKMIFKFMRTCANVEWKLSRLLTVL